MCRAHLSDGRRNGRRPGRRMCRKAPSRSGDRCLGPSPFPCRAESLFAHVMPSGSPPLPGFSQAFIAVPARVPGMRPTPAATLPWGLGPSDTPAWSCGDRGAFRQGMPGGLPRYFPISTGKPGFPSLPHPRPVRRRSLRTGGYQPSDPGAALPCRSDPPPTSPRRNAPTFRLPRDR